MPQPLPDVLAPDCSLSPRTGPLRPGTCAWCGKGLFGRRRRWCSDECVRTWSENHRWGSARWRAIDRATGVFSEWGHPVRTYCDQCGRRCLSGQSAPEVNHVDPRVGAGYDDGCWNHQTNLQVLCHACHVIETARQRRERIVLGWPGAEPHHTWRRMGWTWAQAERYIADGTRPVGVDALTSPLWPVD